MGADVLVSLWGALFSLSVVMMIAAFKVGLLHFLNSGRVDMFIEGGGVCETVLPHHVHILLVSLGCMW